MVFLFVVIFYFVKTHIKTVIFDLDGLLINSEPIWHEATNRIFSLYNIELSTEDLIHTTGLRSIDLVTWYFKKYNIASTEIKVASDKIIELFIDLMPHRDLKIEGAQEIVDFFYVQQFKVGIASSSPLKIIQAAVDMLHIRKYLSSIQSGEHLLYSKPHPQIYLDTAKDLLADPVDCLCFEDSVYGMIASKSARMKCVVVVKEQQQSHLSWGIADLKICKLIDFNILHLKQICNL